MITSPSAPAGVPGLLLSSTATRAVAAAGGGAPSPAPANTGLPAITGTAQEGQILSVSDGSWANAPTGFTYQWRRNGTAITGSINATRTLTGADIGAVITCTVTATNAAGSTSATSAGTVAVIAASVPLPVNSVAPAVTGAATVGSVLTSDTGTWSNSPTSYAYAWRREGVDISGATASTYTLVSADAGKAITCRVFATNAGGTAGATSNTVNAVAAAVDFLLVASGQSEMLGYGLTAADVPSNLQTSDAGIKIWTAGGAWATLANGTNNDIRGSQNWGPEAEFARRWRLANPSGTIYIVKDAIGGTRLAADTGSDWSPTSTGEYFANLETRVANAKAALAAAGKSTVVKAFLWHQGESDSQTLAYANAYQQNLTDLAAAVRSRIGDSATKFIVGKINRYSGWTYRETVRAAQEAVGALTGNAIVDCDSYALQTDYAHFAASGQQAMGADMYAAYMGTYTRPALWTPANDTQLFGWWDAFDQASVTTVSGAVSAITDKAATPHHVAQATASLRPAYVLDGAFHLPCVQFDGVDDTLPTSSFTRSQPFAAIDALYSRTQSKQYPCLFDSRTSGGATGALGFEYRVDNTPPCVFAGGTIVSAAAALAVDNANILGWVFSDTASAIRVNGTGVTGSAGTVGIVNGVSIGSYSANCQTKSWWRERVMTGDLSTANLQKIEGYLAHKWSQPDRLANGHPYRFQAPLP